MTVLVIWWSPTWLIVPGSNVFNPLLLLLSRREGVALDPTGAGVSFCQKFQNSKFSKTSKFSKISNFSKNLKNFRVPTLGGPNFFRFQPILDFFYRSTRNSMADSFFLSKSVFKAKERSYFMFSDFWSRPKVDFMVFLGFDEIYNNL